MQGFIPDKCIFVTLITVVAKNNLPVFVSFVPRVPDPSQGFSLCTRSVSPKFYIVWSETKIWKQKRKKNIKKTRAVVPRNWQPIIKCFGKSLEKMYFLVSFAVHVYCTLLYQIPLCSVKEPLTTRLLIQ